MRKSKLIPRNIIIIIIFLIYMFPLYWILVNSMKNDVEIFANPPTLFPQEISFKAYIHIGLQESSLTNIGTLKAFYNSTSISLMTVLISVVLGLPCAYGIARFRLRYVRILLLVFMIGQMLSPTVKLLPFFLFFSKLKIINTHIAVAISVASFSVPFSILIMRPFFLSISREMEEAASIDGCSRFSGFIQIVIPVAYVGIVVAGLFTFIFAWGNLIYPLTLITDHNKRSMIANIFTFIGEYQTNWNSLLAFGIVSIAPIIIIFIFMQKYIVGGLTMGSVKG